MKALKWLLRIVLGIIVVLAVLVGFVLVKGRAVANAHIDRPVREFHAATDSASIARGEHIAQVVCAGCHTNGGTLPLSGSDGNILAMPGGPDFGVMHAPNVTPGGRLAVYASDGELARAIREGINHEGRALLIMPSGNFSHLSDPDLAALIGYLRQQPAVTRELPPRDLHPMAYVVLGLKMFPNSLQPPVEHGPPVVAAEPSPAYGKYLVDILDCRTCHGTHLQGGVKGQLPPVGPDLVGLAHRQPQAIFQRALRTGVSDTGLPLNPEIMPWPTLAKLSDLEITAIFNYLRAEK